MSQCHVCYCDQFHLNVISEVFRIENRFLRVENIPVMVCKRCSEELFDRNTMEQVRVLLHGIDQQNI